MDKNKKSEISLLVLLLWASAALACAYFIKSEWAVPVVFVVMAYQFGLLPEKLMSAFLLRAPVSVDDRTAKDTAEKKAHDKETFENEIGITPCSLATSPSRSLHSYEQMERKTIEFIQNIIPGFAFETGKKVFLKGSRPLFPDGFFQRNGEHFLLEIKLARPSNTLRLLHSLDSYTTLYENKKTSASFYLALILDREDVRKSFEQLRKGFEEKFESHYKNYNAFLIWIDLSNSPTKAEPNSKKL